LIRSRTISACVLGGAEHQRLLALVDLAHEDLRRGSLALLDLDDLVEVLLLVALAGLDLALDHGVVGRVDVLVQRGGDLLDRNGVRKPSLMPSLSE
jgi:hypothetical protein